MFNFHLFLVVGVWAAPAADELHEIYVGTCQLSCSLVTNKNEAHECREDFCPNYVSYLLTGSTIPGSSASLASSRNKEVAKFCAAWMIHLIEELGWQRRVRLNLRQCTCAAGNDCLVK